MKTYRCIFLCALTLVLAAAALAQIGPPRTCNSGPRAGQDCFNDFECRACDGGANDKDLCASDDDCLGLCSGGFDDGAPCLVPEDCRFACSTGSNMGEPCEQNSDCGIQVCVTGNVGAPCNDLNQSQACGLGGLCGEEPICGATGVCRDTGNCFTSATCSGQGTLVPIPAVSALGLVLLACLLAAIGVRLLVWR